MLVGMGRSSVGASIMLLSIGAVAVPTVLFNFEFHTWPGCAQLWAAMAAMHVLQASVLAWRMSRFHW